MVDWELLEAARVTTLVDERWLALERLAMLDSDRRAAWFGQQTAQAWPRPVDLAAAAARVTQAMQQASRCLVKWRALQILAERVQTGRLEPARFVRLVRLIMEME